MSKKKGKSKRPKDINQLAYAIVAEAVGEKSKPTSEPSASNSGTDKDK